MSDVEGESSSIWEQVSITDNGEYIIEKSYTKKKKMNKKQQEKKKITLSEDIIFNILVRVPVELLYKKFRYVCKQWDALVSSPLLIDQSMLHSKPIHILQDRLFCKSRIFDIKDDELGWSCQPNPQHCYIMDLRLIRCSCNGLLLVSLRYHEGELRVNNPITKQEVTLPRCPSRCPHWLGYCGCGIGFVPSTGEYKVVHVHSELSFEIFTLGDPENTWRKLPVPFRDRQERPFDDDFGWLDPVLVNKSMLHWDLGSQEYIISMDVSNEKLCKVNLPIPSRIDGGKFENEAMLDLGGFLSVFYTSRTAMDVWILKDLEKQVWIKQQSIVSEYISHVNPPRRHATRLDELLPVAMDGTVIFYLSRETGSNTGLYKYDMESRKLTRFKMNLKVRKHLAVFHVNTLIRVKALTISDAKSEPCKRTGRNRRGFR